MEIACDLSASPSRRCHINAILPYHLERSMVSPGVQPEGLAEGAALDTAFLVALQPTDLEAMFLSAKDIAIMNEK